MGVNFAGVDLILPDPDGRVQAWFDDFLPLSESRMICEWPAPGDCYSGNQPYYPGTPVPGPNYSKPPRPKLCTWYRPTGAARWSFGFFLADYTRLQSLPIAGNAAASTLTIEGPTGFKRSWGGCYMLPPHPVSALLSDPMGLWIVPIVDERWWWQFVNGFETPIDNTAPTAQAWADVYTSVANGLGITLTADTVPATYIYPNGFFLCGTSWQTAGSLLDAVAYSVGQRIIPNYPAYAANTTFTAGQWRAANWTTSGTRKAANMTAQFDAGLLQAGALLAYPAESSIAPASVVVVFRISRDGITVGDYKYTRYSKTVTAATGGWTLGTGPFSVTVFSTAVADISTSGVATNPDNKTTLDNLATQIATDYYRSIWVQDQAIPGVSQWQESGFDDWVEFCVGRPDGVDQMPSTRIHSVPYNQQMSDMIHFDSTTWEWGTVVYGTLDGALAALGTQTITVTGADGAVKAGTVHLKVTEVLNASYPNGQYVMAVRARDKWACLGGGSGGSPGAANILTGTFAATVVNGAAGTFTDTLTSVTYTVGVRIGVAMKNISYQAAKDDAGNYWVLDPDLIFYGKLSAGAGDCVGASGASDATSYHNAIFDLWTGPTAAGGAVADGAAQFSCAVQYGWCFSGQIYTLAAGTAAGGISGGIGLTGQVLNPEKQVRACFATASTPLLAGNSGSFRILKGSLGAEANSAQFVTAFVRDGLCWYDTGSLTRIYNLRWVDGYGIVVMDPTIAGDGTINANIASGASGNCTITGESTPGTAAGGSSTITAYNRYTAATVNGTKARFEWNWDSKGWVITVKYV